MEIIKTFAFDAAHYLPFVEEGHRCAKVHGHSFTVSITLGGEVEAEKGWIVDFEVLEKAIEVVRDKLDHSLLNEIEELGSPTLENLCLWIADQLKSEFPALKSVLVERPSIGEGCRFTL